MYADWVEQPLEFEQCGVAGGISELDVEAHSARAYIGVRSKISPEGYHSGRGVGLKLIHVVLVINRGNYYS